MRWGVLFAVVAVLALALTLGLARGSVACGMYPLTVQIESPAPPQRVWCEAISRPGDSGFLLESRWPAGESPERALADPFPGTPLTVRVPFSERDSLMGLIMQRTQYTYLFVRAEFPGGQEQHQVVEIPDKQLARQVTVRFP